MVYWFKRTCSDSFGICVYMAITNYDGILNMGILSYIFGGGNIGVIAKSISKHHEELKDFNAVCEFYRYDFAFRTSSHRKYEKSQEAIKMLDNEEICNYCDLAALVLWVDAAPNNYFYYHLKQDLSNKITKQLARYGLK